MANQPCPVRNLFMGRHSSLFAAVVFEYLEQKWSNMRTTMEENGANKTDVEHIPKIPRSAWETDPPENEFNAAASSATTIGNELRPLIGSIASADPPQNDIAPAGTSAITIRNDLGLHVDSITSDDSDTAKESQDVPVSLLRKVLSSLGDAAVLCGNGSFQELYLAVCLLLKIVRALHKYYRRRLARQTEQETDGEPSNEQADTIEQIFGDSEKQELEQTIVELQHGLDKLAEAQQSSNNKSIAQTARVVNLRSQNKRLDKKVSRHEGTVSRLEDLKSDSGKTIARLEKIVEKDDALHHNSNTYTGHLQDEVHFLNDRTQILHNKLDGSTAQLESAQVALENLRNENSASVEKWIENENRLIKEMGQLKTAHAVEFNRLKEKIRLLNDGEQTLREKLQLSTTELESTRVELRESKDRIFASDVKVLEQETRLKKMIALKKDMDQTNAVREEEVRKLRVEAINGRVNGEALSDKLFTSEFALKDTRVRLRELETAKSDLTTKTLEQELRLLEMDTLTESLKNLRAEHEKQATVLEHVLGRADLANKKAEDVESALATIEALTKHLEVLRTKHEENTRLIQLVQRQASDANKKAECLTAASAKIEALTTELYEVKSAHGTATRDLSFVRSQHVDADTRAQQLQETLWKVNKELIQLKSEFSRSQHAHAAKSTKKLQETLSKVNKELFQLKAAHEEQTNALELARRQLFEATEKSDGLQDSQTKLESLTEQFKRFNACYEVALNRLNLSRDDLRDADAKIESLRTALTKSNDDLCQLEARHEETVRALELARNQVAEATKHSAGLSDALAELEVLTREHNQLRTAHEQQKVDLMLAWSLGEQITKEADALKAALIEAQTDAEWDRTKAERQLKKQTAEFEKVKEQNDDLIERVRRATAKIRDLQDQLGEENGAKQEHGTNQENGTSQEKGASQEQCDEDEQYAQFVDSDEEQHEWKNGYDDYSTNDYESEYYDEDGFRDNYNQDGGARQKTDEEMMEERAANIQKWEADLGLEHGEFDQAALRTCYKKLSLIHHPDKNMDDKAGSEERFKRINEAYEGLKDALFE